MMKLNHAFFKKKHIICVYILVFFTSLSLLSSFLFPLSNFFFVKKKIIKMTNLAPPSIDTSAEINKMVESPIPSATARK